MTAATRARTIGPCPRCDGPVPAEPFSGVPVECPACGASLEPLLRGRTGLMRASGSPVRVRVRVTGCRRVYGRADLQIEPVAGDGVTWIAADRLALDPDTGPDR